MMTLTDKWAKYARFARWAHEIGVDPADAAELLQLAHRAFRAGERECNTGRSADRQRDAFEEKAKAHKFTVSWPGLWPTMAAYGRTYYLPEV